MFIILLNTILDRLECALNQQYIDLGPNCSFEGT